MRVADFHQSGDVGFMRMRGQRITKKNNSFNFLRANQSADLQVAAQRPRQHFSDGKAGFAFDHTARRARG